MASPGTLNKAQFTQRKVTPKDPSGDVRWNKPRFSGNPGSSKTMHIAKGHVPKPPSSHPHHRKAGKRSHRAR